MFKSFRSFAALAASLVAFAFAVPAQAGFPKDLVAKHPCLKEVQSPWYDPMPASKMPEAFKDWDTVYVGFWHEFDGTKVCSAFLLSKVNDDGSRVEAVYTNATPYKREHQMVGKFLMIDGKRALKIEKGDWWVQYVMNADGSLNMVSSINSKTGVLFSATKVERVTVNN